jgi:hypothetical protein
MTGDYIHLEDMGKLVSGLKQRHYLTERADEFAQKSVKPEQLPIPFNAFEFNRPIPSKEDFQRAAEVLGIDEINLNSQITHLLAFVAEDEHAAAMFKKLLTYYKMTDFAKEKITNHRLRSEQARILSRTKEVTDRNAERLEKFKLTNHAYRNQLATNKEQIEARRNKLVRSMNKAIINAGGDNNLSPADRAAFEVLDKHGLIGWDGAYRQCRAQDIELMDVLELADIIIKVIKAVQPFKIREKKDG